MTSVNEPLEEVGPWARREIHTSPAICLKMFRNCCCSSLSWSVWPGRGYGDTKETGLWEPGCQCPKQPHKTTVHEHRAHAFRGSAALYFLPHSPWHLRPKDKFSMPICRQHPRLSPHSLPDRTFFALSSLTSGQIL